MAEDQQQKSIPKNDNTTEPTTDPNTRTLRIGDLVRVSELGIRKSKRLNDKEKSLGRVMNIIEKKENENDVELYEVEWILEGSRLQACEREDLRWTNPVEEGMTYSRSRTKRKPVEFMQYVEQVDKQKRKKTEKKKFKKRKPTELSVVPEPAPEPAPATTGLDVYERHRRELERLFTRLRDRVDIFHHFWEDPPLGLEEVYTAESKQKYPTFAPFNWEMIHRRMNHGRYIVDRRQKEEDERYTLFADHYRSTGRRRGGRKKKAESDARVLNPQGVNWEMFHTDVFAMCDAAIRRQRDDEDDDGQRGTLSHAVKKIKEAVQQAVERAGKRQTAELDTADDRHKYSMAIKGGNNEAAMQSWRKEPFPERKYERLTADDVCDGLSTIDERIAQFERKTSLPDRFIGQAYQYDDTGESETWMRSVVDETAANDKFTKKVKKKQKDAISADDEVIRAQISATMQSMLIAVQDKVMTNQKVMHQPELHSENWLRESKEEGIESDIIEQPVWGIDCYTRKNILLCLGVEFDDKTALRFVEKWLLPAINTCPNEIAHDLGNAARILLGVPFEDGNNIDWTKTALGKALKQKIQTKNPAWLKPCAHELLRARNALGLDFFRVHPKGHGSVVLANTIPSNNLVTFYRGELYPSWRWGEKMDAIEITQKRKHLKPALPDFYNMILERPHLDPRGYGILFVDASRKGGHGSSLSHSCDPTCEVRVASRNGELCLAMTTLRELEMGEELTFDYNAVTESLNEYRSAVCLCGYGKCRGSFLHFATADCYQQVLNRNSPIAARFANLVRGSMKQVMADEDTKTLKRHGFSTAVFGAISVNRRKTESGDDSALVDCLDVVPVWLRTYVAEVLRYIEYERRALPIALICEHLSDSISKESAENDLRKEPQPETPFSYFSRTQKALLLTALSEQGFPESMNRFKRMHAMKKVASAYWSGVSEEKKAYWIDEAKKDFDKKHKAWRNGQKQSSNKHTVPPKPFGTDELLRSSKISFKDADCESVAAMEQRIQQLTQSLSRVGRVLDRHRETMRSAEKICGDEVDVLRNSVQAPLRFLSDIEVVDWMWNQSGGLVKSLVKSIKHCDVIRPQLIQALDQIRENFDPLLQCVKPTDTKDDTCSTRHKLKRALLALRGEIMKELKLMARDYKIALNEQKSSRSMPQGSSLPASDTAENMNTSCVENSELHAPVDPKDSLVKSSQWIARYGRRFVLRAAADVLLMYANTSTFFVLQPYSPLESTPVSVFARELGNTVPKTVIDKGLEQVDSVKEGKCIHSNDASDCAPEDIVSSVSVRYPGEYVFSQLLQWYNAGIGQAPGLPDLLGCAVLPRVADCFDSELVRELKAKSDRKTTYETKVVPALVSWMQDPLQRGSPWPPTIQKAFNGPELRAIMENVGEKILILGSPVVDFLVTGNEANIAAIVKELDASDKFGPGESDRTMLSSVDKGRPAQAVSTWIQCENPLCQKWRRLPWHVDRDTLPEKFECKDNKWNPEAQSCQSPEDDWDASDALVGDDGKVEGTPIKKDPDEKLNVLMESSFSIGARFDVLKEGRDAYTLAKVTKVDFSGSAKRIMFHFIDTPSDQDEWIPFGSSRIAPLGSKRATAKKAILNASSRSGDINTGDPKDVTSFVVGARFDVYRNEKKRFFKAVVKEIDATCVPMKVLFHFLKTSSNADEWAEFGSDRIRTYKSVVPPTVREQKELLRLENEQIDGNRANHSKLRVCENHKTVQRESADKKPSVAVSKLGGSPVGDYTPQNVPESQHLSSSGLCSNPKLPSTSSSQKASPQTEPTVQSPAVSTNVTPVTKTSVPPTVNGGATVKSESVSYNVESGEASYRKSDDAARSATSTDAVTPQHVILRGHETQCSSLPSNSVSSSIRSQYYQPNPASSIPPTNQANMQQTYQYNSVGSIPSACQAGNTTSSIQRPYQVNQQRPHPAVPVPSTYHTANPAGWIQTTSQVNQQQSRHTHQFVSIPPAYQANQHYSRQPNPTILAPPTYQAKKQPSTPANLATAFQDHWQQAAPVVNHVRHTAQSNTAGTKPAVSNYTQGFQTVHAGPREMVPKFSGTPTGMPPPQVSHQLSNSNSQEWVQRPPLSGLDVLAMVGERLELAVEQQPNLTPEQAIKQYMQFPR